MSMIFRSLIVLALTMVVVPAQAQNKVPPERPLEALVKTSLLTFNDANVTGNYAVLHAKLSKPFREQFPVERLAEAFKEFNKKNVDLDIVAALKPVYDPPPRVDEDGKLLLRGYFPTEPLRVYFTFDFIPSDGEWKLIRINVKVDSPT
jgi:hypothetical protein